jgi:NADH-quinone oxidoreductase subunit G
MSSQASVITGGLAGLAAAIDAGRVKTVVSIGEDLTAAGLSAAQLAKVSVIFLGTTSNATSASARVVIPTFTVFEKSGTFVNQQFRIQKFHKAIPGALGATDDLVILSKLIAAVGGGTIPGEVHGVWAAISAAVPALASCKFATIPDTGTLLDSTAWTMVAFPGGETLHYKPANQESSSR